jgi:error-prone DNA polymerase
VDAAASARKVMAGRVSRERAADVQDDRRDHSDSPAQKIRHPRNIRILPNSRDFH